MSYYMTLVLHLGPAFSPACHAVIHSSHESHHVLAQFWGTLHHSIVLFSSCSWPCSHFLFHLIPPCSKLTLLLQSYSSHIVSFLHSTAPHYLTLTACVHARNTHTHTLSLFSPHLFCTLAFPFGIATRLGSLSLNLPYTIIIIVVLSLSSSCCHLHHRVIMSLSLLSCHCLCCHVIVFVVMSLSLSLCLCCHVVAVSLQCHCCHHIIAVSLLLHCCCIVVALSQCRVTSSQCVVIVVTSSPCHHHCCIVAMSSLPSLSRRHIVVVLSLLLSSHCCLSCHCHIIVALLLSSLS